MSEGKEIQDRRGTRGIEEPTKAESDSGSSVEVDGDVATELPYQVPAPPPAPGPEKEVRHAKNRMADVE
ncbi:MAG: hypothetical protein ACYC2Y_02905 [Armatimonadota bacterium]